MGKVQQDRADWLRLQRDEAAALREQQTAAGAGHEPVVGPGPYGDHGVNMLVESAVRAERERCAVLVQAWADRFSGAEQQAVADALRDLAAAIRSPNSPAKPT